MRVKYQIKVSLFAALPQE